MSADELLQLTGLVLSLAFAYLPFVKDWFEKLNPVYKPLLNAGVLLVMAFATKAYNCDLEWNCFQFNTMNTVFLWLQALAINQGSYLAFVRQVKKQN